MIKDIKFKEELPIKEAKIEFSLLHENSLCSINNSLNDKSMHWKVTPRKRYSTQRPLKLKIKHIFVVLEFPPHLFKYGSSHKKRKDSLEKRAEPAVHFYILSSENFLNQST